MDEPGWFVVHIDYMDFVGGEWREFSSTMRVQAADESEATRRAGSYFYELARESRVGWSRAITRHSAVAESELGEEELAGSSLRELPLPEYRRIGRQEPSADEARDVRLLGRKDPGLARVLNTVPMFRAFIDPWLPFPQKCCSFRFGDSDAPLPVGALFVLWGSWPEMTITCPACGRLAVGIGFGGGLRTGGIHGCCMACGETVYRRVGGMSVLGETVDALLRDSPFFVKSRLIGGYAPGPAAPLVEKLANFPGQVSSLTEWAAEHDRDLEPTPEADLPPVRDSSAEEDEARQVWLDVQMVLARVVSRPVLQLHHGRVTAPLKPVDLEEVLRTAAGHREWSEHLDRDDPLSTLEMLCPVATLIDFEWEPPGSPSSSVSLLTLTDDRGDTYVLLTEDGGLVSQGGFPGPVLLARLSPNQGANLVPGFLTSLLASNGETYGLAIFRRLPTRTRNHAPDSVPLEVLHHGYGEWMELATSRGLANWFDLRDDLIERPLEPSVLGRSVQLIRGFPGVEELEGWLKRQQDVDEALTRENRERILALHFAAGYEEVR